jgi:putative effector of murein hydrolase
MNAAYWQMPAFSLALTVTAFWFGEWCYKRSGKHLLTHPFAVAFLLIIAVLNVLPLPYTIYRDNTDLFRQLLSVATVALAVPVYLHRERIARYFVPLLVTLFICSILTVGIAVGVLWAFGLSREVILTMATKSITTPIAVALSESLGGSPALAASFIMVTGLMGAILGLPLMQMTGRHDDAAKGIAFGLTAHAVGTSRALEESQEMGAFSALAMGLTGIMTALLLPLVVHFIDYYR